MSDAAPPPEPSDPPPRPVIPGLEFVDPIPFAVPVSPADDIPWVSVVDVHEEEIEDAVPYRPGPNIGMALVWALLFFAVQVFAVLGLYLAFTLVAAFGPSDHPSRGNGPMENPGMELVLLLVITGTSVVFALTLVGLHYRGRFTRKAALRGFHPWHLLLVLLLVVPEFLLILEVHNLARNTLRPLRELLPHFLQWTEPTAAEVSPDTPWVLVIIGMSLLPAIGEELMCRGFLSRGLVARHGVILGTLFTAFIFALLHIAPIMVCYTFVMGIFLQIVYLTTKTLLAPMLLHALHNFLAIVVARPKLFSGDLQSWLVGINRGELLSPLLLLSAFAAATTICLLLYLTRTRWRLPNGAVWNPGYVTAETPPTMLKARARLR